MNFIITEKHIELLKETNCDLFLYILLKNKNFDYKQIYNFVFETEHDFNISFSSFDLHNLLIIEHLINGYENINPRLLTIEQHKNKTVYSSTIKGKLLISRLLNGKFLSTGNSQLINLHSHSLNIKKVFSNKIIREKCIKYRDFYIFLTIQNGCICNLNICDRYLNYIDGNIRTDILYQPKNHFISQLEVCEYEKYTDVIFRISSKIIKMKFHKKYTYIKDEFQSENFLINGYDNTIHLQLGRWNNDEVYHAFFDPHGTYVYRNSIVEFA